MRRSTVSYETQSRRVHKPDQMFDELRAQIEQSKPLGLLSAAISGWTQGAGIPVTGIAGSLVSFVASSLASSLHRQILIVASDRAEAEQLSDDLNLLHGDTCRLFTAARAHSVLTDSGPLSSDSIAALRALRDAGVDLIVAPADALPVALPDPEAFKAVGASGAGSPLPRVSAAASLPSFASCSGLSDA